MNKLVLIIMVAATLAACDRKQDKVSTDLINIQPSDQNTLSDELPVLTFDTTWHDYGQVVEGQIVKHTFHFENTGEGPLVISRVEPSCGCTTAKDWSSTPYAPGESGKISVEFDTNNRPGKQNKSIQVIANTSPSLNLLYLSGTVVGPEN